MSRLARCACKSASRVFRIRVSLEILVVLLVLNIGCLGSANDDTKTKGYAPKSEIKLEKEPLVVTETRENEVNDHILMLRAYNDHRMGLYYFNRKAYDKAMPYLLSAAKFGFKDSQARLGYIFLHGLGSTKRNDVRAVGWLGVAASGKTKPVIKRFYESLWAEVPQTHSASLKVVVEKYTEKFGQLESDVICEYRSHARTFVKELRCDFTVETELLTAFEIDDLQSIHSELMNEPNPFETYSQTGSSPPAPPPFPAATLPPDPE